MRDWHPAGNERIAEGTDFVSVPLLFPVRIIKASKVFMSESIQLGMATFNADGFVEAAIQHVVQQYHDDWTMVVSDNGSTDRTLEIVRSFSDPRIRVHCQPRNLGLRGNFRWLFENAAGADFFAWVSDHDLRRHDWLSKSLDALKADETAALATSNCYQAEGSRVVRRIDENIDTRDCFTPGARLVHYLKTSASTDFSAGTRQRTSLHSGFVMGTISCGWPN